MSLQTANIGDVCLVKRGTTITQKMAVTGDIPVIAGGLNPTYFHDIPNRAGNVITVSGSGASAGYVNFWDVPIFASDCSTVESKSLKVDIKFVFHYLLSKQDYIYSKLRSGAAQPHVYAKDIALMEIPIPSLPEQRRIAAILDQADALRVLRREALAQLDSLTQSIFIEMFGDSTSNNYEVKHVLLSEVTTKITDGTHLTPKFISSGVPFIFVKNFNNGQIDFQTDKFISEEEHASLYKRCPVEQGDILYTSVGATYGQAVTIGSFTKFAFQRHVAHLKPDAKKICPDFLGIVMKLPFVKRQADRWARGAAQPTINLTELRQFEIPLPTLTMQRKFIEQVALVEGLKDTHRSSLSQLNNLFASLQHRAFRGEL